MGLSAFNRARERQAQERAQKELNPAIGGMTVKQLQAFAAENNIDLGKLKKKPEILAQISAVLNERG